MILRGCHRNPDRGSFIPEKSKQGEGTMWKSLEVTQISHTK